MRERTAAVLSVLFLVLGISAQAQQTAVFRSELKPYYDAVALMEFEQYEPARKKFDSFISSEKAEVNSEYLVNATYYRAVCAMELFHKDAEYLMEKFVLKYPESIWLEPAILRLGRYNFNRRDYDDALRWFNRLDPRDLDDVTREEIVFKKGFSAFELEDFETAKSAFYRLKDKEGAYYGPSNYYYGHIAYTEGNYQTALESFKAAGSDENFAAVVPYYIAQIYHFQQKYDELIEYAAPMLENEETKRTEEIARLLGNAHFQKQEYAEAIPYLEVYMERNYNPSPDDAYQLAYSYYRTGEYPKAIDYFAKATKADGELGQIATYQMADAYVQMGEKKYAQNAFKVAAQMDYDREVTEDALFNYAKLAYELSYDPFHEAITAFERYLKKYPDSDRKDEAYEFLLKVYLATKNYTAALEALDKIKVLDPIRREQYQRAAYNLAVSEMNKGENESARTHFELSAKYPEDPEITAMTDYLLGDINYRTGDYDEAVEAYNRFLNNSAAYRTDYYNTANYNIGYANFKQGTYAESLTAFRKFVSGNKTDPRRRNDAFLRIGDLYLVLKDYGRAIESYQSTDLENGANADYALFQTAMAYGYQDKHLQKIQTLNRLFEKHPETSLAAVSQYELGESYFLTDQLDKALASFSEVIDEHAQSPYRKKALLKRGLVQYRMGAYEDAIAGFKTVVEDYGVDSESQEAIATLKNIYLDLGRVDEFSEWLAGVPDYEVSPSEMDSLTYQAAENMVAEGNCDRAIEAFEKYLSKYPRGLFAVNAKYYMADCAYRKNNFNMALEGFEYVIDQPASKFTESALLGAADILYRRNEYDKALPLFKRLEQVASFSTNVLEAQIGQMRSNYQLGNYEAALANAGEVISDENSPERIVHEARLTRGRINFALKSYEEAVSDFKWLAENVQTKDGAEAKFRLAHIRYLREDYTAAENTVFELIQTFSAYDYWKVKGFLLLADVYAAREDYFQARTTLEQIIDNVEDEALLNEAKAKLEAINQKERESIEVEEGQSETDTSDFESEYDRLMDEENENQQ